MIRCFPIRGWLALTLIGFMLPSQALAEDSKPNERLLIFDFKATDDGDSLLAQTAQGFLVNALSEMGTYDLMQKADMVRLLKLTEERQQLGCADSTCAAEYGKLLDAGLYIRGDLARIGGKPVLTLQLGQRSRSSLQRARERVGQDVEF